MISEPVRVGIIGCGHAAISQARAIAALPEFELAAVCDRDLNRLRKFTAERVFTSPQRMLDECQCDLVSICVPPHSHVDVARHVIQSGKSVLVEKPLGTGPSEYAALLEFACRGQATFSALHAAFGLEVRWAVTQLAKRAGTDLALGPVVRFRCSFNDPYCRSGILLPETRSLGGAWLDSGINALSVLARFTPLHLWRPRAMTTHGAPVDILSEVIFDGPHKGVGTIRTSWIDGQDRKVSELWFASGVRLSLDHSAQSAKFIDADGRELRAAHLARTDRLTEHYVGVFNDLSTRLRRGRTNLSDAEPAHRLLYEAQALAAK